MQLNKTKTFNGKKNIVIRFNCVFIQFNPQIKQFLFFLFISIGLRTKFAEKQQHEKDILFSAYYYFCQHSIAGTFTNYPGKDI